MSASESTSTGCVACSTICMSVPTLPFTAPPLPMDSTMSRSGKARCTRWTTPMAGSSGESTPKTT
jgi:hypothetical protein